MDIVRQTTAFCRPWPVYLMSPRKHQQTSANQNAGFNAKSFLHSQYFLPKKLNPKSAVPAQGLPRSQMLFLRRQRFSRCRSIWLVPFLSGGFAPRGRNVGPDAKPHMKQAGDPSPRRDCRMSILRVEQLVSKPRKQIPSKTAGRNGFDGNLTIAFESVVGQTDTATFFSPTAESYGVDGSR